MADLIDPTVTGDYPVVLGDGLLKRDSNEIFTGIRYNHKPDNSGDGVNARLKPSIPGDTSSYDLILPNKENRPEYAYAGTRNTDDGQYVLYFDPEREVFVLDRIDSTFNMNITRVPGNTDPAALREKYPHIGNDGKPKAFKAQSAESKPKPTAKARAKSPPRKKEPPPAKKQQPKPKPKQPAKNIELALPQPSKSKPAPAKSRSRLSEDEEEDDDNEVLDIDWGDGASTQKKDFSPAFPVVRRFDDFMDDRESEADDADGESDDDRSDFKLPSPVNNPEPEPEAEADPMEVDDEPESEEDPDLYPEPAPVQAAESPDLEYDLEKDMEQAFEEAAADSQRESPQNDGDESEISEED